MKRAVLVAGLWIATIATATSAVGQTSADHERRMRDAKARHDKAIADMKRKHPNLARDIDRARGAASQPSHRGLPPARDPRGGAAASSASSAPAFNPSLAPQPADWLRSYITAAQTATSMEQVLPYLPESQARYLRAEQAAYDPREAAKRREERRKRNPQRDQESLDYLSNPPYENALKFHKELTGDILEILRARVDGNKAFIRVSTTSGATIDGVEYPYGAADIKLVGEGSTWKLAGYESDLVVYLEPPKPK
jgi:hypothetical protein